MQKERRLKLKANVLLCIPEIKSKQLQDIYPPIGLAYIHSTLLAAGYNVFVINLNFHDYEEYKQIIERENIDYVMSGGTSYDYQALAELFAFAKRVKKEVITIGGGVGYTSEPIVFAELTNIDYAVVGEGEIANVKLLECLQRNQPVNELNGIIYKDSNGQYKIAKPAVPVENIDDIPFPNYDGFEIEKYFYNQTTHGFPRHFSDVEKPRIMLMMNSRSCPYNCSFCLHPVGSKYRERNIDLVFEEIYENIEKYQINGIFFADELFANNLKRVEIFCERIKPLKLRWFVELRVDFVTEKLVRMLKEAGCVSVLLGLEGYTERVLKDMRKGITPKQIKEAVEVMYAVGMRMEGHFIFGTPLEDEQTYQDIFQFWRDYRKAGVDIVWLFLYPGTRYYQLACDKGIIRDKKQFIIDRMPHLNITSWSDSIYYKYARISTLTLADEDHYGDILSRHVHGKVCDLKLRCPQCGSQFLHKNIPIVDVPQSTGRLSLEIPCDACGHYSYYPIRNKDAWVSDIIKKQLLFNEEIGFDFENILLSQSIHTVGIIGIGEIIDSLKNMFHRVKLVYVEEINGQDRLSVVNSLVQGCDAIIIANPIRYEKIKENLYELKINKPIVSVVNLLFDFNYHV